MSLQEIQAALKSPKNQYNSFAKYNYRNQEDILESVKPLLAEYGYSLVIGDEIIDVCNRVYVKATATIYDGDKIVMSNTACAREPESKKGMDDSQLTGATSSYARKYALNGLFAIDDTKDADSMDNTKTQKKPEPVITEDQAVSIYALGGEVDADFNKFLKYFKVAKVEDLQVKDYQHAVEMLEKKRIKS